MSRRGMVLAAAVIVLASCGGDDSETAAVSSSSTSSKEPAATTTTTAGPSGGSITIQSFAFSPATLNVAAGSNVTTTNRDGSSHTWTADGGAWNSGNLAQNASFSRRFDAAGSFAYHCAIHTFMTGTVQVG